MPYLSRWRRRLGRAAGRQLRRPGFVVMAGFATAILVVTVLLMLPPAHRDGPPTTFLQAVFTATSAVCVTGLVVVDTPTHWTTFGETVILSGIQFGGLGFMTSASLLGLAVARRMGLRSRVLTAAETKALGLGDVRRVVRGVALISFSVEATVAIVLGLRLWLHYDTQAGLAAYQGVFQAVSAFNNAGFALYSDNLIGFATDPIICLPLAAAVVIGGLGFPVVFELGRELRTPRRWSVHTKITLLGTAALLVGGTVAFLALEWRNPATLGPLGGPDKLLVSLFQGGVQPRTAGFNSIDYADANETSLLVTDVLMFIGGGSGGTAGGIKVTTFMLLFFAILAEARGDPTVDVFGRQLPPAVLRQALSVALLSVALVVSGTVTLQGLSGLELDAVLFEAVSAFGTVGLSTGITATLPGSAQYVLIGLMFAGRIGPITLASALALRERRKLYRLPEERPIVG
ncbi:MAG TPA: potassium transporter TrkG [Mycobacteriales bacterium]